MRIGIVTFTYGDNYGQRLQNYAVQELLKKYADDVLTIPRSKISSRGLQRILKEIAKNIKNGLFRLLLIRHAAFKEFDKKHIAYNPYQVIDHKLPNEQDFTFFVAGSDQIWSPFSCDVDDSMFLTFTQKKKRIALSPSIAAKEIPKEKAKQYCDYWNGFTALSVREENSAALIRRISGREAKVLIDPTLALSAEKWDELEKESGVEIPDDYILQYYLGSTQIRKDVADYAKEHKLLLINLFDKQYMTCGPCDFLRLIRHAKMVVTDSYHGTIFSMLYHVPFCVVERTGKGPDMSSRFDTLFKTFEIDPALIKSISEYNTELNFDRIDEIKNQETKKLRQYLDSIFG